MRIRTLYREKFRPLLRRASLWKNQFKDKTVEKFTYTKSGATSDDEIDAMSGATVTTNAMTNGVNAGLVAFRTIQAEGGV